MNRPHARVGGPFASESCFDSYPILSPPRCAQCPTSITRLRPQQTMPPLAHPRGSSPAAHHLIRPFHRMLNQSTLDTKPRLLQLARLKSFPRISHLNLLNTLLPTQEGTLFLTNIRKLPRLSESGPPLTAKQGAQRPSQPAAQTAASPPTIWAPSVRTRQAPPPQQTSPST